MADIGTVSTQLISISEVSIPKYRPMGIYQLDFPDGSGSITGSVQVLGTAQAYKKVHLYWRDNGEKIKTTLTDGSGNFSFTELDVNTNKYFVVATTDHANGYNAIVYDKITPA